jgi:hypothetical protein
LQTLVSRVIGLQGEFIVDALRNIRPVRATKVLARYILHVEDIDGHGRRAGAVITIFGNLGEGRASRATQCVRAERAAEKRTANQKSKQATTVRSIGRHTDFPLSFYVFC